ncbi:MAG: DUF4127 family protein, partial [Treponemataceae bacterium]|nr:DUF4127 family protein [Treponemataceae bacterium]
MNNRILLLPLDERPCNTRFPALMPKAGVELCVAPTELLGLKKKPADRILAATLSVAMTVCFTPLSVFAEPEQQPTTSAVQDSTNESTENVVSTTNVDLTTAETTDTSQTIESTNSTSSTDSAQTDPTIPPESSVTEYELHLKLSEEYKDFLKIWLNEQETTECSVKVGDEISLKLEIIETDDAHYRLSGINFGANSLFEEDVNGKSIFEGKFSVTQEMIDSAVESGIIDIQIETAQVYQVTFLFNPSNGTVVPTQEYTAIDTKDPSKTIGTVVLNQDDTIGFTATPNEHYRVSEIKIDEKSETYNENDKAVEVSSEQFETNKDHTIEVFFMLNKYSLKATDNIQNGSVTFSNNEPEYGDNVDVTITPNEGYYISSISLDGEKIPASKVKDGIYTIENITENH